MKKTFLYRFCHSAMWGIACGITGLIFLLNFLFNATVSYDTWEKVTTVFSWKSGILILLVGAVLLVAGVFIKNISAKISEKKLFLGLTILFSIFAVYLMLNGTDPLHADQKTVFEAAKDYIDGFYDEFQEGGYIYRYPHQLGLLLYNSIIARFSPDFHANYIVNFLCIIGINYLFYKISDLLFANKSVNIMTILASFAFLPQFFYFMFVYGLTPGFLFMTLAFYHALRYDREERFLNMIGMILSCAAAVLVRNNYMIGVIAIALFLMLKFFKKEGNLKNLLALVAVVLCLVLPTRLVISGFEAKTQTKLDNASPTILWIAMGTDLDNNMRCPGWYDGTNWNIYTESGYDAELAAAEGRLKMRENLLKMKEDPAKTGWFFLVKTISQWCEPLYQSLWYGGNDNQQLWRYQPLVESLYGETWASDIVSALSKFLTMVFWGFALVFLILNRKKFCGWEMFLMFSMGGVLFHTFWEAKSQYVYPFVFVLIPFAMYALWQVVQKLRVRKDQILEKRKALLEAPQAEPVAE